MTRLPGLDLLRAVAIIAVMLFHSFVVGGLGDGFEWLSMYGWAGVDIFFVLSGFLIGTQVLTPLQAGRPLDFGAFYARRAWRILPAFAVVLAVYVWFPALREAQGLQPWWQFATFTFNVLVDYGANPAFSHAWSLCVEEHFYLLFPLIAWWLARRPTVETFVAVCACIVLLGLLLRTTVYMRDASAQPARNWFAEDIYFPTWMRLDGLLAGVMLATLRVYRPQAWRGLQRHSNALALGGVVLLCVAGWLFRSRVSFGANTIGWPILSWGIALLVFAAADRGSVLGRWSVPGAGWIAAISYSLYLSHKLAFHAVQSLLGDALQGHRFIVFGMYVLVTLVVGAALHYAVERPFLQLRDRRGAQRREATSEAGRPSRVEAT